MKKEEIIYVRILTVIGASALMALILIFGAGSGLFQRIANGINDTTLQLSNADAAIYSLYFYKGLDVLYRILYAVTVFGLILTAAAMFFKLKGAGIYAVLSSVFAIVTGAYIVLCSIFEGNTALRRIVIYFYCSAGTFIRTTLDSRCIFNRTGCILPCDCKGNTA